MYTYRCIKEKKSIFYGYLIVIFLFCFFRQAHAQGVPSDLIDLSMDDLFRAEINPSSNDSSQKSEASSKQWNFSYNYRKLRFEGYKDGTKNLSNSEVLWDGILATRTDKNFPVLPDVIVQEIHAFISSYNLSDKTTVNVVIPYVKQSTDHFSIAPGYSVFNITSEGLGDISVTGSFQLSRTTTEIWKASIGLSLPTGSIDEEGDTPRAPGDQQLPYSMQLGSGTYDIPANINYTKIGPFMNLGAQLTGKIRLGENDRNYKLGNRLSISSWVRFNTISWVKPSIKLAYKHWGSISGADTEIQVPAPPGFPYPAAVTNPDLFGGKQVDLFLGARFPMPTPGQSINIEISAPIYQDLNGPQSKEVFGYSASFNFSF